MWQLLFILPFFLLYNRVRKRKIERERENFSFVSNIKESKIYMLNMTSKLNLDALNISRM